MEHIIIYVLSDSVGETAQQVVRAAMSQFNIYDTYEMRRFPYISDETILMDALNSAKTENAMVVYTLVNQKLCSLTREFCDTQELCSTDLLSNLLEAISVKTNKKPSGEAGIIRKMDDSYFHRVEAIEFSVKYDDGKDPRGILQADLVLVGVSRTSKTPLSMYLANMNIKVANVPLVPEIPVPKEVFEVSSRKVIGLTNSPDVLNCIRTARLKSMGLSGAANYANYERILQELDYSDEIIKKIGCPVINVANRAIEETAAIIIDIMKENGIKVNRD
ncbi:MAG: kinase/pyrophosphorylase [Clostridioides sp.]|jgi:regulator of PEP synthase PpsR (kinase-PPPase family)|nr:kinase/pyrophosphorylase [Clostridioides sp.]